MQHVSSEKIISYDLLLLDGFITVFDKYMSEAHLPTILYCLGKDSIIITQAITISGQAKGCHGVKEAGSQTTEASIAKACVLFNVLKLLNVKAKLETQHRVNNCNDRSISKYSKNRLYMLKID